MLVSVTLGSGDLAESSAWINVCFALSWILTVSEQNGINRLLLNHLSCQLLFFFNVHELKVSFFLINKTITGRASHVCSIRKLLSGMLLVETNSNKLVILKWLCSLTSSRFWWNPNDP